MKRFFLFLLPMIFAVTSYGQTKQKKIKGMYIQWGYNTEWYSNSNIHFKLSNGSDFVIHSAKASDKPDLDAVYKKPIDISIPQYNYRIGFYLNDEKTRAIEINFDHAKYVVNDFQKVHVTGIIEGIAVDGDSILNPSSFLHVEHTDGANWLHINYVQQKNIKKNFDKTRPLFNLIGKAGLGINIPRTDFTWKGDRLNNNFHVAGYNLSIEGGIRYYFSKKFFLEGTGKTGYVRYMNALANTTQLKNNYVKHGFGYFEMIALIGYDIRFK
ncbi:MAG: hypothetical protein WCH52_05390 [Bacteroidota bacterium]